MKLLPFLLIFGFAASAAQALQFEPSVAAAYGIEDEFGLGYEVHARVHTELGIYAGAVFSQFPSGEYEVSIPLRGANPFEGQADVESYYYGLELGYRLRLQAFDIGFELRGVQVEESYDAYAYLPNDGGLQSFGLDADYLLLIPSVEVGYRIDAVRLAVGASWIDGEALKVGVNSLTTERQSVVVTASVGYGF